MNSKVKPALLGGLIIGVLSAIPFVNYCCCIWAIGGGALATFLYIKGSTIPVRTGDGAMVGGLAGLVGGLIYLIIGVPIAYLLGAAAMEQAFTQSGIKVPLSGALLFIVSGLVGAIVLIILAVVGGLVAVPIFEKRKDDVPPPPPAM